MRERQYLTREQIHGVRCPKCGANPGALCTGRGRGHNAKSEGKNHLARMQLAQRTIPRSEWTTIVPEQAPEHRSLNAEFEGRLYR